MGTNLPNTVSELNSWAALHAVQWKLNPTAIGLTAAQASAFEKDADDLASRLAEAETARQASKDATLQLQAQITRLRANAGAFINTIKSFAEATNNPAVYSLAGISPDAPRGTVPPPVAPESFTASVNSNGSITVKFKVSQPAGVTNVNYLVFRRVNSANTFQLVGTADKKSFTDLTLPLGVDRVEYIIQPKRGSISGPQSSVYALQFGSQSGPGASGSFSIINATSTPAEPNVKLAA
jgi:hypothetical protein